ncbi:putative adhesin [Rickettsia felis str. Pedreira]|uniref:Adhesin n=2 Tax=Rickettsia felis TaxID=42862 RepID=Q4UJX5_RICFE|nr:porin family protein [Rickettsia felis]AAY62164.1 unknown [Rickettsia felis URRWXCal2]KHO02339.1 adhesin [Rickettsia felis str. LSU]KHO02470.1 adhesin [Rickettsia felis]KJV58653.1 putative adhesin [Rickettsia felis str. Pedreira]MDE8610737.1 porin family protein [Rickettsia felis]
MKKLLLIAAASTALLTSGLSFADCDMNSSVDSSTNSSMSSSMENQWYLKLNAGGVIFDKAKPSNSSVKLKSNTGFTGNIGAGYYIMDNLRTDFTIGMVTNNHMKKSTNVSTSSSTVTTVPTVISAGGQLIINGVVIPGGVLTSGPGGTTTTTTATTVSVKHKPTIVSALLNGYVDFIDVSMFKVFAGAGVGAALVKEKVNISTKTVANNNVISSTNFSGTTKNKTNFAYQLSLGTSFEVAQGVKAELVYSWTDYGKSKTNTKNVVGNKVKFGGTRYKGNNLMAGLRFDM